jgi:hypothetical protein
MDGREGSSVVRRAETILPGIEGSRTSSELNEVCPGFTLFLKTLLVSGPSGGSEVISLHRIGAVDIHKSIGDAV